MAEIQNSKQYDLENRILAFAKRVRAFVKNLRKTIANIAKESRYWLRLIDTHGGKRTERFGSRGDGTHEYIWLYITKERIVLNI